MLTIQKCLIVWSVVVSALLTAYLLMPWGAQ